MNYDEMHAQYIHSEMPHVILDAQGKTPDLVMFTGTRPLREVRLLIQTSCFEHGPPRSAIASQGHPIDLVPKWQPPRPTGLTGAELHPVARVAKTGSCYV